ncbi:MAG: orotidine-5'-phosphate decarboxylase [Candidatus Caldatribacteriota bacterium]
MLQLRAKERLIIALDVDNLKIAGNLVDKLGEYVNIFKIGNQLFTAEGTQAIKMLKEKGKEVFLDLKFHDIPNTVARAAEAATRLGVYIFNLHISGGLEMMRAAVEASRNASLTWKIRKPIILGVTILTSINQKILEEEIGIKKSLEEQVANLAKLAQAAGLDGVIASSREIEMIRKGCGEDFIILTPGMRPAGKLIHDQKRVMTPGEAIKRGADFIVVGRPIREAANPVQAMREIIEEMEEN